MPVLFVTPFYCYPSKWALHRNAVFTVIFRLAGAGLASIASVCVVEVYPAKCGLHLREWIGVDVRWPSILLPLLMLTCAYIGAAVEMMVGLRRIPYTSGVAMHVKLRNLVAGPFLEEVTFRACTCRVMLASGFSVIATATTAPLFFGFAHVHHIVEGIWFEGRTMRQAIMQQLALFVQTTLFGFFACAVYLSQGSLVAPTILHIGCNWMGTPWLGKNNGMSAACYRVTQGLSMAGFVMLVFVTSWMLTHPHAFVANC